MMRVHRHHIPILLQPVVRFLQGCRHKVRRPDRVRMHILLATDGSEYSGWALRFVTRLQLSSEDRVTVLHVIGDRSPDIKHLKSIVAPRILDAARTILEGQPAQTKTL